MLFIEMARALAEIVQPTTEGIQEGRNLWTVPGTETLIELHPQRGPSCNLSEKAPDGTPTDIIDFIRSAQAKGKPE